MSNRDDFSKETIRDAASRVGYRCSHPDCRCATIGASMETNKKSAVIGVGAHICAAAPGGPRYDPSMTSKERKSIDNCIWLCQTHSKLIDTDIQTYTVELLHKWKREAELQASHALSDVNYYNSYFLSNGNDTSNMETVFEGLVIEGNFKMLSTLLSQYNNELNEIYYELVLRYKIIYDIYCNRFGLISDAKEYSMLECKNGIDIIIKHLIIFDIKDCLTILVEFCTDDKLRDFAQKQIDDKLKQDFLVPSDEANIITIPKHLENLFNKYVSNLIFCNEIYLQKDVDDNLVELYDEENYFSIQRTIFEIGRKKMLFNKLGAEDFATISNYLESITLLDIELQKTLIVQLLRCFQNDKDIFEQIYAICNEELREHQEIKELHYCFRIMYNMETISISELTSFCDHTNNYISLELYLSKLPVEEELNFLNEHQYLYSKDSYFIYRYYYLTKDDKNNDSLTIIEKYSKHHENDFVFKCTVLLATTLDKSNESIIIDLFTNLHKITPWHLWIYIDVLCKYEKYDELYQLSNSILNMPIKYRIAQTLHSTNIPEFIIKAEELYITLINSKYMDEGIHFKLALIQNKKGEKENAKNNFKIEFELYGSEYALINYLNLRYETFEFKDDIYLQNAKNSLNAYLLNIAGATLVKLNKNEEAFKYLIRSLLVDKNNPQCIKGLFFVCNSLDDKEETISNENTVCVLRNDSERILIAIHEPGIIKGLNPNDFANCQHYSSDDPFVTILMFSEIGDKQIVHDKEYVVEDIIPLKTYIGRFSFSCISKDPSTITISGTSTEEAIKEITKFMQKSSNNLKSFIESYNHSPISYPISMLAKYTGNSRIIACHFLAYENDTLIRNNINKIDITNCTLVLSYDSIVYLMLSESLDDFCTNYTYVCPSMVADVILNDIEQEMLELKDSKNKGKLHYDNNRLTLLQHDKFSRGDRYRFLTKFKTFIEKCPKGDRLDYIAQNEEIKTILVNDNLSCEKSCLAVANSIPNGVLLTDDQFLYSISQLEKIHSIGLCSILCEKQESIHKLIENARKLKDLNFATYFTLNIFNNALELISSEEDTTLLVEFLLSDQQNEEASNHHRSLILNVYRDYITENKEKLFHRDVFHDIAFYHFAKLNPVKVQEIISDAVNILHSETAEE